MSDEYIHTLSIYLTMGVDGDASPPREFDEFETGIEEMLQHLVRRDANEQASEHPLRLSLSLL